MIDPPEKWRQSIESTKEDGYFKRSFGPSAHLIGRYGSSVITGPRHAIIGERTALFAACAWAVYPYAIYFSAGRVWDYALTALLFSLCFWAAQSIRRISRLSHWVLLGLLFGVTTLSNPSIATLLPILLLFALRRTGGGASCTVARIKAHPAFSPASPFAAQFASGKVSGVFALSISQPSPDTPNAGFATLLTVMMLCGLKHWWKHHPESDLSYLAVLLVFPVPYYLTHTSPDYRQPIEPMIVTLVTAGIFGLRERSPKPTKEEAGILEPLVEERVHDRVMAKA